MESIQWVIDQLGRNAELTTRPISKGTRSEHALLKRFKWCPKCESRWECLHPKSRQRVQYPGILNKEKFCSQTMECPRCRQ